MIRLLLVAAAASACAAQPQPVNVIIMAGQSNCSGVGKKPTLAPELRTQPDVLLTYAIQIFREGWGSLRLQRNSSSQHPSRYGAEMTLGRTLTDAETGPWAIIKTSIGGTQLYAGSNPGETWNPTVAGSLVGWSASIVATRLDELQALGYAPTIAGIIWIQGEDDSSRARKANAYDENLTLLAAEWRARYGPVPIYVCKVCPTNPDYAHNATVRAAMDQVAAADGNMFTIEMCDLPLGATGVHLTGPAYQELGYRLAAAILNHPLRGCPADMDLDGLVTGIDFDLFCAAFEAGDTAADLDHDGHVTGQDFDAYVIAFEEGC